MKSIFFCVLVIFFSLYAGSMVAGDFRVVQQTAGPVSTNCYLFYDTETKDAAIFDVSGSMDSLTSYITANGLFLRYIFLTHAHWDHVEGLTELINKFPGAKVCLSREEYSAMQKYLDFAKESDLEKFNKIQQDSALAKMISFDLTTIKPDIFVSGNDEYKLGNMLIKAILAPGHSAGSTCYSCSNILFTGDVLFYRTVGNTDFYLASREDQVKSVRNLYGLFPDSTIVYPGHGQLTDIGTEKKENKYVTADGGKWDVK